MSDEEFEQQGIPDFLRDPVGTVRRRWRWMTAALVLGVLATVMAVVLMPMRYRATAALLLSGQQIPEEFVRTTVPQDLSDRMAALVAQALSQERLVKMIEERGLYPTLRDELTMGEIAARLRSEITVELDASVFTDRRRRTDNSVMFHVGYSHGSAETAAAVVNQVAGRIVEEALRMRTEQASLTTEFLRRELKRTELELREVEGRISEFKRVHRGALPSELQANLAKLERLQQERDSISLQLTESATRVAMLASQRGAAVPDTPALRLAAAREELAQLRRTYTDAHPDVRATLRDIELLEEEVAASPGSNAPVPTTGTPALVAAEQRMLQELRAQQRATDAEILDLEARVTRTPKTEEELEAMVQRETVLREQYLDFLRKVQDAELAESLEQAQQGERLSVLSWATAPRQPENNRLMVLLGGLAGAIAFAGLVGFALEALDPVLVSSAQIEAATGLPVLGSAARIS